MKSPHYSQKNRYDSTESVDTDGRTDFVPSKSTDSISFFVGDFLRRFRGERFRVCFRIKQQKSGVAWDKMGSTIGSLAAGEGDMHLFSTRKLGEI